jgi:hypothetical protein
VPVLCIGGRSMLDEAAGAMLAAVLAKRGLGATALPPDEISPGHITTLASSKAKAVCLSYLGLGSGPAHIRYLVRRLRRLLPKDTLILVAYWHEEEDVQAMQSLQETAQADAYATTLHEAVETILKAATGTAPDSDTKPKTKPAPKGKTAPATAA